MPIEDSVTTLDSREDFAAFMERLADDWRRHRDDWENADTGDFLDAAAAWSRDAHGYYRWRAPEVNADIPSWRLLADAMLAGRVYE